MKTSILFFCVIIAAANALDGLVSAPLCLDYNDRTLRNDQELHMLLQCTHTHHGCMQNLKKGTKVENREPSANPRGRTKRELKAKLPDFTKDGKKGKKVQVRVTATPSVSMAPSGSPSVSMAPSLSTAPSV